MQISIDTGRDSKEDIIKAIKLLQSIIGEGHITTTSRDIFSSPQPEVQTSPFGSFFDNVNKTQPTVEKKELRSRVELY